MAQADAKSKTETKPAKRQRGRPVGSGKDAAIVRSRILRCFADLTSRHGITAVSLSRLASELGMSIATIYKHFANKEELVDATVAEWVDKYRAANIDYKKFKGVKTFEEGFQVWAKGWAEQL